MYDLGPFRYFLGLKFSSTSNGIYLLGEVYSRHLSHADTPMELGVHL
jgi:hypothetical protein